MEHWDRLRGDQGFYWDDGLFRPSTDTFLLGGFPVLRRGEQVCDLGAGTGLLGALLLTREPSLTVTGLELREDACRLARRTAQRSGWQERLLCRQGDLRRREDLPRRAGSTLWCPILPISLRRRGVSLRRRHGVSPGRRWCVRWRMCAGPPVGCCGGAGASA